MHKSTVLRTLLLHKPRDMNNIGWRRGLVALSLPSSRRLKLKTYLGIPGQSTGSTSNRRYKLSLANLSKLLRLTKSTGNVHLNSSILNLFNKLNAVSKDLVPANLILKYVRELRYKLMIIAARTKVVLTKLHVLALDNYPLFNQLKTRYSGLLSTLRTSQRLVLTLKNMLHGITLCISRQLTTILKQCSKRWCHLLKRSMNSSSLSKASHCWRSIQCFFMDLLGLEKLHMRWPTFNNLYCVGISTILSQYTQNMTALSSMICPSNTTPEPHAYTCSTWTIRRRSTCDMVPLNYGPVFREYLRPTRRLAMFSTVKEYQASLYQTLYFDELRGTVFVAISGSRNYICVDCNKMHGLPINATPDANIHLINPHYEKECTQTSYNPFDIFFINQ